jgi:hypothetical protein
MNKRTPLLWFIASAIGSMAQIMMGVPSGLLLILTMVVGFFALNRWGGTDSFIKFNVIFAGMVIGGTFLMLSVSPDLANRGGSIGVVYQIAFTYPLFLLSWVVYVLLWKKP